MPSEFQGPHRELLEAPDRDNCPGARPVLAYRSGDDPEYLAGLDTRARQRVRLERRGVWHGEWVELEAHQAPALSRPREALLEERWHRARPIFLPALLAADDTWPDQAQERLDLFESLQRPEGLSEFVAARPSGSGPHWRPTGPLPLYDPSRDLACLGRSTCVQGRQSPNQCRENGPFGQSLYPSGQYRIEAQCPRYTEAQVQSYFDGLLGLRSQSA